MSDSSELSFLAQGSSDSLPQGSISFVESSLQSNGRVPTESFAQDAFEAGAADALQVSDPDKEAGSQAAS